MRLLGHQQKYSLLLVGWGCPEDTMLSDNIYFTIFTAQDDKNHKSKKTKRIILTHDYSLSFVT